MRSGEGTKFFILLLMTCFLPKELAWVNLDEGELIPLGSIIMFFNVFGLQSK